MAFDVSSQSLAPLLSLELLLDLKKKKLFSVTACEHRSQSKSEDNERQVNSICAQAIHLGHTLREQYSKWLVVHEGKVSLNWEYKEREREREREENGWNQIRQLCLHYYPVKKKIGHNTVKQSQ